MKQIALKFNLKTNTLKIIMGKILVLSDIHYPLPDSDLFVNIIMSEKPDKVILLGDNVDNYNTGRDLLDIYKEFIEIYKKIFPLEKTIVMIGDNDYQDRQDVFDYVKSIPKINGKNIITYSYKNLFLFHGNLETSHWQEAIGKYAGIVSAKISTSLLPQMLARQVIKKYQIPNNFIVLLGHIHYLGYVNSAVFCGTLNKERIIYPKNMSMGYVIIEDSSKKIDKNDITVVQLDV